MLPVLEQVRAQIAGGVSVSETLILDVGTEPRCLFVCDRAGLREAGAGDRHCASLRVRDPAVLSHLLAGRTTLAAAVLAGGVQLRGDPRPAMAFARAFFGRTA